MKKIIVIISAFAFIFTLCGCGNTNEKINTSTNDDNTITTNLDSTQQNVADTVTVPNVVGMNVDKI